MFIGQTINKRFKRSLPRAMVGSKFAKKGKNINLIHQASQLKRKAVMALKT
jgi:hypothetical protein